jgi:hypothetical protein
MEIAHRHTGVLRVIAKFALLGLLVVLLAKAILAVVALALLGFVIYLCARTVYLRRHVLSRIAAWTKDRLMHSIATAFRLIAVIAVMSSSLLVCVVWLRRVLCGLVCNAARISLGAACKSLWQATKVLASALLAILFYGGRTVATCTHAAGHVAVRGSARVTRAVVAAGAKINGFAGAICGTVVEIASGALVGAILLNLKTVHGLLFLPEIEDVGARACAAALVGAFLGITLAVSRATWARQGETTIDPN